jgi:uncharacterized protein (DUF3084 family)
MPRTGCAPRPRMYWHSQHEVEGEVRLVFAAPEPPADTNIEVRIRGRRQPREESAPAPIPRACRNRANRCMSVLRHSPSGCRRITPGEWPRVSSAGYLAIGVRSLAWKPLFTADGRTNCCGGTCGASARAGTRHVAKARIAERVTNLIAARWSTRRNGIRKLWARYGEIMPAARCLAAGYITSRRRSL